MTDTYELDGITPSRIERPDSVDALSATLKQINDGAQSAVLWGGGTRMHVGNFVSKYDVAVDMTGLDQIVDYRPSDLVVVAEAGMTVSALQAELGKNNQRLPFDVQSPDSATIGGSLASNNVGPLRNAYGGIRDMVIGMSVVQADGTMTKSGGSVVKNVAGYDMARLHIGALGTLGAISTVAFKIGPIPQTMRTVAAWFDSVEAAAVAGMRITNGSFMPEAVIVVAGARAVTHAKELATQNSGSASENAVVLVIALAAGPATVERQVQDTTSTLGAAMADGFVVLDGADQGTSWKLAGQPGGTPSLAIRSTQKPTSALELVSTLSKSSISGDIHLVGQVGFGTVEAYWNGETSAIPGIIESARSAAHNVGGALMIERCPPELKSDLDVFGDLGAPLEIMRRMKQQYDPKGTLSPGRFAGRI
ncbi:MAG: FAD-binding oxidoreductase [Chloroflexi bacterium]|mgnify:FL=1|nr:FAD-binding oxidoreductase [Chloroflexota bacterium]MBT4515806.1 FAD-binding oxidoreductase [Chloroflexota bacterium]MBT5319364.1 FAD-binding oxidoreductase [Chloroflexota bacterium]MBT6680624.1 FAD-binding oxidoreductase [Chloroflexota bacterium]